MVRCWKRVGFCSSRSPKASFGGTSPAKDWLAVAATRRACLIPLSPGGGISLPLPVPPLIREGAAEGGAGEENCHLSPKLTRVYAGKLTMSYAYNILILYTYAIAIAQTGDSTRWQGVTIVQASCDSCIRVLNYTFTPRYGCCIVLAYLTAITIGYHADGTP
jgi:hypothetical protein